ncbi:MAG: hypothetical protein HYT80_03920, partial [Euryarchaeota archaeon]|nr:hypothetical protein [Euryarchaeota archaeon]
MHWIVPVAVATVAIAGGATAFEALGPGTVESEACADPIVVPYEGLASQTGTLVIALEHSGTHTDFAVCVWSKEVLFFEQFTLGDGDTRTITLDVPMGANVYHATSMAGRFGGGAAEHLGSFDLAKCAGRRYAVVSESSASPFGFGSGFRVTECEEAGTWGSSSATNQYGMGGSPAASLPTRSDRNPGTVFLVVGGGAGAAGWLMWAFVPRFRYLGIALFTRLTQPTLLRLETRSQIHELVHQDPGIHANAIASRLELGHGTTEYHLRVLVRERLLDRVVLPGFRCYFPHGRFAPLQMRRLATLRTKGLSDALHLIRAQPGITQDELRRRL